MCAGRSDRQRHPQGVVSYTDRRNTPKELKKLIFKTTPRLQGLCRTWIRERSTMRKRSTNYAKTLGLLKKYKYANPK